MIQENLKNLRKQKGISQEKMAKILGTDTSNYSRKERGEVKIFDDEWDKLAKTLEVPLEQIKNNDIKFPSQFEISTLMILQEITLNIPTFLISFLKPRKNILKSWKKRTLNFYMRFHF